MSQSSIGSAASAASIDVDVVISQFKLSTLNENPIFAEFTWTKRADQFIVNHVRNQEDRNITWITGPGGCGKSTWAGFHEKENGAIKLALASKGDIDNLSVIRWLG